MKQKLALACTLVHEPALIVLDEPTTGVDPVSRREFWKLLSEFLSQGITIVMATPYLDEAERCARVALLHEGRLLALDRPARCAPTLPGALFEVIVARPPEGGRRAEADSRASPASRCSASARTCGSSVTAPTTADRLAAALAAAGLDGRRACGRLRASLEDVFIARLATRRSGAMKSVS